MTIELLYTNNRSEQLKNLTKRLKAGEITIDRHTRLNKGELLIAEIFHKYSLGKYEAKTFDKFMATLKYHNRDAYKIIKDTITTEELFNIMKLKNQSAEEIFNNFSQVIEKRKSFTLSNSIVTSNGHISTPLEILFSVKGMDNKIDQLLNGIMVLKSQHIYPKRELTKEEFLEMLPKHKSWNLTNVGMYNRLSDEFEQINQNDGNFTGRSQSALIKKFKYLTDSFAILQENNTGLPMIFHYATSPDFFRPQFQNTNYKQGIGIDNYFKDKTDSEKEQLLNISYHGMTPLEAAAQCHKTKGHKNNLIDTMESMIKHGAKPTEKFWDILEMKGEHSSVQYLKTVNRIQTFRTEAVRLKRSQSESDLMTLQVEENKDIKPMSKEEQLLHSILYYLKEYFKFYPNLFVDLVKFIVETSKEVKYAAETQIKSHTERANSSTNIVDFRR